LVNSLGHFLLVQEYHCGYMLDAILVDTLNGLLNTPLITIRLTHLLIHPLEPPRIDYMFYWLCWYYIDDIVGYTWIIRPLITDEGCFMLD
jgi:hypothetical protein